MQRFDQYKQKLLDEAMIEMQDSAPIEWAINQLPQGFMLTQRTMRHSKPVSLQSRDSSASEPDLLHMVYSDGLASVSIFIEKNQGPGKHVEGASTMGAVNAYGHAVGDSFVTVVGEVPVRTVQSMAQSIVRVTGK
jgi:sigma-E factor negative regulatory protein RseB